MQKPNISTKLIFLPIRKHLINLPSQHLNFRQGRSHSIADQYNNRVCVKLIGVRIDNRMLQVMQPYL